MTQLSLVRRGIVACVLAVPAAVCVPASPVGAANPAYTDATKTDDDFAFQGEYVGEVPIDGSPMRIGVHVVALGEGKFDVVAYPGGLPGDGWQPPTRVLGTGTRAGTGADAVVKIEVRDEGGQTYKSEIRGTDLNVLGPDGQAAAKLAKKTRKSPTLGAAPPAGATVLFDGKNAEKFLDGKISPDGLLMEGTTTKDAFGDATWHVEFLLPYQPKDRGQGRANSGVYVQGAYEVQVLDSFGLTGENNECGGIYSVAAPAVNMCLPPLQWQTYDIDFTAPRFEGDTQVKPARMTVKHNGVVIHDNVAIEKITPGGPGNGKGSGPLFLQNHGNPVRFRNIWVVPKKS